MSKDGPRVERVRYYLGTHMATITDRSYNRVGIVSLLTKIEQLIDTCCNIYPR